MWLWLWLLGTTPLVLAMVDVHQQQRQQQQRRPPMNRGDGRRRRLELNASETFSSQALKQKLLENYDRTIFPFEKLWENSAGNTTERRGLDVELGINFHRVFDVDVTTSVADLIVWVRQRWKDPRLVWDESEYNVSSLHFWVGDGSGSGGETSEIWTSDVTLWNLDTPISTTLSDAHAIVSPDGTVFWSRPGHIKPVCKFQGLEDFPFDTLDCSMELGSWSYSGLFIRPIKMGEGFSVGGSETAGESYAEYSLLSVSAEEHIYPPFISSPEEDWPVVLYHFTFQRAWQPYARGFLTLQIILNVAAFCCLWLPPHIGERMSLSITSVLAAVASELVVAAQLPPASEQTWFSKFSIVSLLFTGLVLFESAAVIYFHYHTGDDLKPRFYQWIERKLNKKSRENTSIQNVVRFSLHHDEVVPETHQAGGRETATQGEGKEEQQQRGAPINADANATASGGEMDTLHDDSELDMNDRSESSDNEERRTPYHSGIRRTSFRTRERIKTILGRDADDFKSFKEMENNMRWQRVARGIDEWARVLFPTLFAIFLASTFAKIDV